MDGATGDNATGRREVAGCATVARAGGLPDAWRCLVVMCHYVRDDVSPVVGAPAGPRSSAGITVAEFRSQLEALCRVAEPVGWARMFAAYRGRASLPGRSFLVSFDDGLLDHARNAVPVLEELGIRGTFFVPGAVLAAHCMLPAHAIHKLLSTLDTETLESELRLELRDVPETEAWSKLDDEAVAAVYDYETRDRGRLKYLLNMVLPVHVRNRAIYALFNRHVGAPDRWGKYWYLGWDDVVCMEAHGHTIGGHGFSHEPLANLPLSEARLDLARSAEILRTGLGPDFRPMSYPFGRCNDAVARFARDAGFAHGFTTEQAWATTSSQRFHLPRVDTIDVDGVLAKEQAWQAVSS